MKKASTWLIVLAVANGVASIFPESDIREIALLIISSIFISSSFICLSIEKLKDLK